MSSMQRWYVLFDRDIGTASSWSLSRLDSLADEVRSCFMAQHLSSPPDSGSGPNSTLQSSPTSTPPSTHSKSPTTASDSGPRPGPQDAPSGYSSIHPDISSLPAASPEDTALSDRQFFNTHASSSGRHHDTSSQPKDAPTLGALSAGTGPRGTLGQSPPAVDPVVRAMQEYPMQTFAAVNTVLFERHGYTRMQIHGNPK